MNYISVAIGLTLGNFFYQWVFGPNWGLALDRSLFQVSAVLLTWVPVK